MDIAKEMRYLLWSIQRSGAKEWDKKAELKKLSLKAGTKERAKERGERSGNGREEI
jgi:hypothetical protein